MVSIYYSCSILLRGPHEDNVLGVAAAALRSTRSLIRREWLDSGEFGPLGYNDELITVRKEGIPAGLYACRIQ